MVLLCEETLEENPQRVLRRPLWMCAVKKIVTSGGMV